MLGVFPGSTSGSSPRPLHLRCREGPEGVSRTPFVTVVFWSPLFTLYGSILDSFWLPFCSHVGFYFPYFFRSDFLTISVPFGVHFGLHFGSIWESFCSWCCRCFRFRSFHMFFIVVVLVVAAVFHRSTTVFYKSTAVFHNSTAVFHRSITVFHRSTAVFHRFNAVFHRSTYGAFVRSGCLLVRTAQTEE